MLMVTEINVFVRPIDTLACGVQVASIWAAAGGRAMLRAVKICNLLCRYRWTLQIGATDLRCVGLGLPGHARLTHNSSQDQVACQSNHAYQHLNSSPVKTYAITLPSSNSFCAASHFQAHNIMRLLCFSRLNVSSCLSRLQEWLRQNHTLEGPCYAQFPMLRCKGVDDFKPNHEPYF